MQSPAVPHNAGKALLRLFYKPPFFISFHPIYQRLHTAFHQLPFIKPTTSFISKFYCISKFSVLHCTAISYLILSLTRWVVQKISDRTPGFTNELTNSNSFGRSWVKQYNEAQRFSHFSAPKGSSFSPGSGSTDCSYPSEV